MSAEKKLLSCYNRGCGADFDPLANKDGEYSFHTAMPTPADRCIVPGLAAADRRPVV